MCVLAGFGSVQQGIPGVFESRTGEGILVQQRRKRRKAVWLQKELPLPVGLSFAFDMLGEWRKDCYDEVQIRLTVI